MYNLFSNLDAPTYTISAFVVGYLLIDGLNPAEQNALGSWFMLLGQTLCSNSSQQQVINNKNNTANNTNSHVINSDFIGNNLQRTMDAYNNYQNFYRN